MVGMLRFMSEPSLPTPFFCSCVGFNLYGPSAEGSSGHRLKSHLTRTQGLKVLPLKRGVGQYIAMHATLTARDFLLDNFYPSCVTWLAPVPV